MYENEDTATKAAMVAPPIAATKTVKK
jgi:hypothetical protein